jgi:transposase, IS30 family
MGERYDQLSLGERCSIARLREAGRSIRQIASALDRPPSTISRELRRNAGRSVGYRPDYAEQQARARRWSGSRLERNDALRDLVLDRLADRWSPEQIAGRLAVDQGAPVISYESIYRFIYAQIRRTNDYRWRLYLPRAKSRRGRRRRPGGSAVTLIPGRVPLAERPPAGRDTPGHWEADLMLFAAYGQVILAAHERSSRLTLVSRPPGKAAAPIADQLIRWLAPLPTPLRTTISFDNGGEFARHQRLHKIGTRTYFCDTHSPWQKGGIENAIGRLRKYLPRKTNLDDLTPGQIERAAIAYNNTPRKCLDFKTPAEAFQNQLLHFECESTFQLSLE